MTAIRKTGLVHFYRIIGTPTVIAEVLEPGDLASTHSSVTTVYGKWYGTLGTRVLPKEVDALPYGNERLDAVMAHRIKQADFIRKALAQLVDDPEVAEHFQRTTAVFDGYRYEWSDQIFADFLSGRNSSANYFPVEWTEYKE